VCVISGEATYTNFIVFDLTRPGLFMKRKWKIVPVNYRGYMGSNSFGSKISDRLQ